MAFSDVLAALRKQKGLSQTQVAAFLSERGAPLTQKGVSKWECGDTTPNAEQFLLLCDLYEIRDVLSVFLHKQNTQDGLNALGQSRMAEYRALLLASDAFCRPSEPALPLYDMDTAYSAADIAKRTRAAAVPAAQAPKGATLALCIRGESMTPLFESGQLVYVRECSTLATGDFGVFYVNGRLHCKLYMAAGEELVSVNEKFPPMRIRPDDAFQIIGAVIL